MTSTELNPSRLTTADILSRVERLKQAIWHRRQILGDIMQKHGNESLFEYSADFMDINPSPLLDNRKHEIITVVKELITARLGAQVGEDVALQLERFPLVSTTDHHSPIQHPFWINTNIISAIPYGQHNNPAIKNLIVFSFSSVSVNNASGYPRGVLFHGNDKDLTKLTKLPLLPDKLKMSTVYGVRKFSAEEITRAFVSLKKMVTEGGVDHERSEGVMNILKDFFASSEVLDASDFCSQITKINYRLWPYFFHSEKGKDETGNNNVPGLIYLEIETIVAEMLLRYHLYRTSSHLHKVIFNPTYQTLFQELFNNLPGALSLEHHSGTHLFWGLDAKKHRVKLFLKDNVLCSLDNTIRIDLTPDTVVAALENKVIYPSMVLCYLTVSLFYGLKCLGGFCQVHDLTMIKKAWRELLERVGEQAESQAVLPVQTKELGGDGMVLAYLRNSSNELFPATGLDMILYKGDTSLDKYREFSKFLTLTEVMNPMLPEMYTVLYASSEREEDLVSVTPEEIARATGLEEKIRLINRTDYAQVLSDLHSQKKQK